MRVGVDIGGTKIEAVALDHAGQVLGRVRRSTPRDYAGTLAAVRELVGGLERRLERTGTVGVGMPGTISPATGLVKNANAQWLNGRPLQLDLARELERDVRCTNDANCLAASEARDGAAAGAQVVFAAILGTGCGGGLAIAGRVHAGAGGLAGEWGHNARPWPTDEEYPGPDCYCGKRGCLECWVSGTGFAADYERATARSCSAAEVAAAAAAGDVEASAALGRYESRLARGLATIVNTLDPDVIVLGGGMSNVEQLYQALPKLVPKYVFGGECDTPIRRAMHGDSSGVRGAAWLCSR
jgi:fructokinase